MPGRPSKSSKPCDSGTPDQFAVNPWIHGRLQNCTLELKRDLFLYYQSPQNQITTKHVDTCFGWAVESKALPAKMLFASDVTNQPTLYQPPSWLAGNKGRSPEWVQISVEMFKIPSGCPLPCRWSEAVNISPLGNHDSPPRPSGPAWGKKHF